MQVTDTKIAGVKIIQPKVFGDARGFSWKPLRRSATGKCWASI